MENKENTSIFEGWRCPQCGAVMSPFVRSCVNCIGKTVPVIVSPDTTAPTPLTVPYPPTTTPIHEEVPWWVEYNRPITITCETKPYKCWL